MFRRLVHVLVLLLGVTLPLSAQELRGIVARDSSGAPAAGVLVEAVGGADRARVGTTLTDARGYFILPLPADVPVTVRALRVGFRPTEFGRFTLGVGETRTEQFVLTGDAVVLERIVVMSQSACGAPNASARLVATLLDEARKALRSTQVASMRGRLSAEWSVATQVTTLEGTPITAPTVRQSQSSTDRPFVSLSPDSLARVGYLETHENTYTYFAPGAEVLLSEEFVAAHCFQAVPRTSDDREWIGLAFNPAQSRRGIVGIQGTLWVDRPTAELRRLDYSYVNLPRDLASTPAGGNVEFLRLPSGVWLVNRWSIRMPRPTETEEAVFRNGLRRAGTTIVRRINSMEIASGEVREIRAGNDVIFTQETAMATTEVERSAASIASLCSAPLGPDEGVLWGRVLDTDQRPVAGARLGFEWRPNTRWIAAWQRTWETRTATVTTESDGSWFVCAVLRDAPVKVTVTAATGESKTVYLRVGAQGTEGGKDLVFGAAGGAQRSAQGGAAGRAAQIVGAVDGRVLDSLRTGGPWAGATVRVLGTEREVLTGAEGRFRIDSLPPGEYELSVWDDDLLLLNLPLPSAVARVRADGGVDPVVLTTLSPNALFAQQCGRARLDGEAVLMGEVRDLAAARRSGLEVRGVWARMTVAQGVSEREEHVVVDTTDARGRFTLCGVPSDGEAEQRDGVARYGSGTISLQAADATLASGVIAVQLGGAALRRRDLIVGTAQDLGRIQGRVLDPLGKPIAEATVVLGGADGPTTRTDSLGRWALDRVRTHSTELAIRALGFTPEVRELDPLGGRLTGGEIRLQRAPQVLAARTITGRAGDLGYRAAFEDRKRTYAFGTFMDDSLLARQPVVTPMFVIRQIPKARQSTAGQYFTSQSPFSTNIMPPGKTKIGFEVDRGFSAMSLCFPRWFVDGVDFGVISAEEEELYIRQAKRIEAYKAGLAPAQYNDFDGCGVMLIWTR